MGMGMLVFTIIALILALGATVVAFIFIVPEKKRENLNKIGKLLHDIVNFKFLIVEKILQALYIFCTAFAILVGFFMLFQFERISGWGYSTTYWGGGRGLLIMFGGPIGIRLVYEMMMMFVLLVKNVIQINNKTKAPDDNNGAANKDIFDVELPFPIPEKKVKEEKVEVKYEEPAKPTAAFCSNCGARVDGGMFCSICGKKL